MSLSCNWRQLHTEFSTMIALALLLVLALPAAASAQRAFPVAVTHAPAVSRVADPIKSADHYVVRKTAVGGGIGAALGALVGFAYSSGGEVMQTGPAIAGNGSTTRTRRRNYTLGGAGIGAFVGGLMGYGYARSHPIMQQAATLTLHPAIDTQ